MMWLGPAFKELLDDATTFNEQANNATTDRAKARNSRAAIIFGVAAIEACTNDALAAIIDVFREHWVADVLHLPPYIYLDHLSRRRPAHMIRWSSLDVKVKYILNRVRQGAGRAPSAAFSRNYSSVKKIRNRIGHMSSLAAPNHQPAIMNPNQLKHVASMAVDAAAEYTELVEEGFAEMDLAIRVFDA